MGTDVNPKLKEMLKELHELAHQIQVRYPYNINLQRQVHFLVYKLDQLEIEKALIMTTG